MEVGALISLYRKQAGMTIDELAEHSGVPKGTLNKIIGGVTKAPTLPNMKAIAKALGKSLEDFDDLPIKREEQPTDGGGLSNNDKALLNSFHLLNDKGQAKVIDYARDLAEGGNYSKNSAIISA